MQTPTVVGLCMGATGLLCIIGLVIQISFPCCGDAWDCYAHMSMSDVDVIDNDDNFLGFEVTGLGPLADYAGCMAMNNRRRCCDRTTMSVILGAIGGCLLLFGLSCGIWGCQESKRSLKRKQTWIPMGGLSQPQPQMTFGMPQALPPGGMPPVQGKGKGKGKGAGFGKGMPGQQPMSAPPPFSYGGKGMPVAPTSAYAMPGSGMPPAAGAVPTSAYGW